MTTQPATLELLRRWHSGEHAAFEQLLRRDLPWMQHQVARRMGAELRGRADIDDVVQVAMVNVLQHGPRFQTDDLDHYRAMMLRIVENTIRKLVRDGRREKRWAGREEPLPSGSVVALSNSVTQPASAADRNERRAWLQLALEMLDTDDRDLILQRQWHGRSFKELAQTLGISEDAARKRFDRAVARLAHQVMRLRSGQ